MLYPASSNADCVEEVHRANRLVSILEHVQIDKNNENIQNGRIILYNNKNVLMRGKWNMIGKL